LIKVELFILHTQKKVHFGLITKKQEVKMEFLAKWITSLAFLIHLAAGLDTKMFQLTMPNVRPYRVSWLAKIGFSEAPYASETTSRCLNCFLSASSEQ
jgi:hypothetical protein